jgi:hypothetical protein
MKGAIANAVAELQRMSPPAVSEPFSKILVGLLAGTLLLVDCLIEIASNTL